MRLSRATLISTVTSDGLCELGDNVKTGTVYYVDLDSIRMLMWGHVDRSSEEERLSIFVDLGTNGTGSGWMPTEFLDIPELQQKAGQ